MGPAPTFKIRDPGGQSPNFNNRDPRVASPNFHSRDPGGLSPNFNSRDLEGQTPTFNISCEGTSASSTSISPSPSNIEDIEEDKSGKSDNINPSISLNFKNER